MAETNILRSQTEVPVPVQDEQRARSLSATPLGRPVHNLDIRCASCPGQTFRRSRLRSQDFPQLLRFRYPVRCLTCRQRQLVSFTVAGISLASYSKHQKPAKQSSG